MQCESTLQEAITVYLARRKTQGYALNTLKTDASALWRLDWFLNSPDVEEITDQAVLTFMAQVSIGNKASTINLLQSKLSHFFNFCREHNYAPPSWNPLRDVRQRRIQNEERKRIPVSEFGNLLNHAANPRDRIVVALGLYLFLRASEIVALRLKHLDMAEKQVNVTIFKTSDFDVMPICSELHTELKRWLSHYQKETGHLDPEMYLTPSLTTMGEFNKTCVLRPYNKISRPEDVVKRLLRNYGWTSTESKGEGIHLLRRSGARALFDELDAHTVDGALRVVQSHLHHKSSTMTEKYLGISADRAKRDRLLRGEVMFPSVAANHVAENLNNKLNEGLALVT